MNFKLCVGVCVSIEQLINSDCVTLSTLEEAKSEIRSKFSNVMFISCAMLVTSEKERERERKKEK